MTRLQQEIKDLIIKRFDYISKMNALRFVKDIYGTSATVKDIVTAYNSIEWDY